MLRIALVGNPNSGKSTVFNLLTGLRQKTGNYPGVTVDKRTGNFYLPDKRLAELTDLPGAYSLYARSADERVVIDELISEPSYDCVVVVADATNLRRHLLLYTQIRDLGLRTILLLNMNDLLEDNGWTLDVKTLASCLQTPVILFSARSGQGLSDLMSQLAVPDKITVPAEMNFEPDDKVFKQFLDALQFITKTSCPFKAWQYAAQPHLQQNLEPSKRSEIDRLLVDLQISIAHYQTEGIARRFKAIDKVLDKCLTNTSEIRQRRTTAALDRIMVNPFFGFVLFFVLLLLIFQAIFSWSAIPMDAIDSWMALLGGRLSDALPQTFWASLLTDGLLPGITGVIIFVPQIALLFLFISLLEESGYMARVVFIMDRLLRPFGLNGKSVVPLMSGAACAIPAIMAARTIENEKERLLTILVTPFITCSARLPIYVILIALVVPADAKFWGIGLQAWSLMGLYLLGAATALGASWVLDRMIKRTDNEGFFMEMPLYKMPQWKNIGLTIYERSMAFVTGAGKIILSISLLLWVLASLGPNDKFYHPEAYIRDTHPTPEVIAAYRLEHSFIGYFGKGIEPVIEPLGYNWKIGIALLTSFAAREVFVGTMATIYGLEDGGENSSGIISQMRAEINPSTGAPVFTLATAVSLLLFYAFAMQCMSTLAIVKRELKSWKYPLMQFIFMTLMAYFSAFAAFATLS